jgi:hypothetical protein
MGKFKAVLDNLELREVPLHGRKFTWTNSSMAQSEATMTRSDRMFSTTEWEEIFPLAHLHAWASMASDHSPLILQGDSSIHKLKGFRFKTYCSNCQGSSMSSNNHGPRPCKPQMHSGGFTLSLPVWQRP